MLTYNLQLQNTLMFWQQRYQEDILMQAMERPKAPMDLLRLPKLPEPDAQVHIDLDLATRIHWQPQYQNQSRLEVLRF